MKTANQWAKEIASGEHGGLDALAELVLEYLRRADAGERDLICLLRGIELSGVWKEAHTGAFTGWLKTVHIDPDRYQRGLRALDEVPAEVIDTAGFALAKQLTRIADPERRAEAQAIGIEKAKVHGAPLPERTARDIVQPFIQPTLSPYQKRIRELEQANVALQAEVDRLRALVVRLGGDPDAREEDRAVAEVEKSPRRNRSKTAA